jgi:hypothetical protein
MAEMFVSGLRSLPAGLWEGVFAADAAWFGNRPCEPVAARWPVPDPACMQRAT